MILLQLAYEKRLATQLDDPGIFTHKGLPDSKSSAEQSVVADQDRDRCNESYSVRTESKGAE
jgi:hypothetical protein